MKNTLSNEIREFIKRLRISGNVAATAIGVSPSTLDAVLAGKRPSARTYALLSKWTGLPESALRELKCETIKRDRFDERMAIRTDGKRRLAEHIVEYAPDAVIDLGCGECAVGAILREMGYEGRIIAVDKRAGAPKRGLNITFVKQDILEYMRNASKQTRRIAIVLSAVLHEITGFYELAHLILEKFPDCLLLIREPIWSSGTLSGTLKSSLPDIPLSDEKYGEYVRLNAHRGWTYDQIEANYLFARSYGPGSWEREKHEGRFTFDAKDIENFIQECGGWRYETEYEHDPIYEKTLPYGAGKSFNYTGTLIVCRKGE